MAYLAGGRVIESAWKTVTDFFSDPPTTQRTESQSEAAISGPNGPEKLMQIAKAVDNKAGEFEGAIDSSGNFLNPETAPAGGAKAKGEDLVKRCERLRGTLAALVRSPVVPSGANIEKSKGLRACLYALETEYNEKSDCRQKLLSAGRAAKAGNASKIKGIIRELESRNGEQACPETLNILQGKSPGAASPILTLKRSSDSNTVPNLRNVLNDYVDVQYHITLSMVPEVEARRLQDRLAIQNSLSNRETIESLRQKVRLSGSVTLASTGEVERNLESVIEEPKDTTSIEDIDAALYSEGPIKQIQSNLQKLANLWNQGNESNIQVNGRPTTYRSEDVRNILNRSDFKRLTSSTAGLVFDARVRREEEIVELINAAQSSDNLDSEKFSRSSVDVSNRNYYSIKTLKIDNVHSPEYHDPFISNLTSLEMILQEPHGLGFNEDLMRISSKLGYNEVNPGRILYRIDIWFSGYNPMNGEFVQNIGISDRGTSTKPIVSHYVVMTGMEANFTTTGTEYNLSFAPQGLMSIRPEEFSLEGASIPTGGNPTLGTFLKKLAVAMRKKRKDETKEGLGGSGINRIFKFYVPDVLSEAPFYQDKFLQRNNLISEDAKDGQIVTIGKDVDIMTLLRSVLSDLPEVQTAFLTNPKTNSRFIDPVVHFTVRFNVRYLTKRPEMHDYDGIIYEYIIEPFLSYKKLGFDNSTIHSYTSPSSQIARVHKMLQLGMIQRVYDYLNTSENTDVMNFDVKLNRFYFESFRRSFDPGAKKGLGTAALPSEVESASNLLALKRELEVNLEFNQNPTVSESFQPEEESLLRKIFGPDIDHSRGTGNTESENGQTPSVSGFRILQASLNTTMDPDSFGSTSSDGNLTKTKDEYLQRFNDHYSLDLIELDSLELRGDPVWLLTPYASANSNVLLSMQAKDTQTGEYIQNILQPHGEKVIFLNILDTEQYDFMNPERYGRGRDGKPNIIAGFYGISGSENTFEGGKFTQKLKGYKLAHLNYAGQDMLVENLASIASKSKADDIPDGFTTSEWITQVLDQAENLPEYADLINKKRTMVKVQEALGVQRTNFNDGEVQQAKRDLETIGEL